MKPWEKKQYQLDIDDKKKVEKTTQQAYDDYNETYYYKSALQLIEDEN